MSTVRNLPMTIGIAILLVAFFASLRGPRHDRDAADDATQPLSLELSEMRASNRQKLKNLQLGMAKEQAMAVMGTRTYVDEDDDDFLVPNPYRSESYQAPDGTAFELLSYYTEMNRSDSRITKDETTPLIFENGKLIGWGWLFVDKLDMRHATPPAASAPAATLPAELPPVEK